MSLTEKIAGFFLVCFLSSFACRQCYAYGEGLITGVSNARWNRDEYKAPKLHAKFKRLETPSVASSLKKEKELMTRINANTVCSQLTCPEFACPDDSCKAQCDCPPIVECRKNATEGFCTCDQQACPPCKCPKPKCPKCPCKQDATCPTIECPPCPTGTKSGCPGQLMCDKPECNAGCRKPKTCNCPKSDTCKDVRRCLHCPTTKCPMCPPCPDYYCSPCDCVSDAHDPQRDPCVKTQGCPSCKPIADMLFGGNLALDPRLATSSDKSGVIVNFKFYPVGKRHDPNEIFPAIPGQYKRHIEPSPAESLPDTVPFFEEELSPTEGKTQHVLMAGYILTLFMMLIFGAVVVTQNYYMEECLQIVEETPGEDEDPCLI